MPNPVMHFEIPADDVQRAKNFYEKIFQWKISLFPMPNGSEYFGITTKDKKEEGINGGLMKRNMPGQLFTNYITVDSIDAFNAKITANGGTVVMPKTEIAPNMGWISVFKDPEGNMMGLHQASIKTKPAKPARKKPSVKKKPVKKKGRR